MVNAIRSSVIPEQAPVASPPASTPAQALGKETFMQLLVAQVRNQNPLNPADGVQFLTQLAQFSELEQMANAGSELSKIREGVNALLEQGKTAEKISGQ